MRSLEALVRDLERLEAIASGWSEEQRATAQAIRSTVEDIQAEAFRRLIRAVKQDPGGLTALREAVDDPWVFNVLSYHGLLKPPAPPVEVRVEEALASVRPTLAGHQGDVQLVAYLPPDEVRIRLLGTCDGCAFSTATVKLGIEKAIREAVPEIERVVVVKGLASERALHPDGSPFELPWWPTCAAKDVPEGGVLAVELEPASVLLTAASGEIKAYPNACPHLGMPLEMGEVRDGVITCTYHGFQFLLGTGECLTVPEIALPSYPVRVEQGQVLVQVAS